MKNSKALQSMHRKLEIRNDLKDFKHFKDLKDLQE